MTSDSQTHVFALPGWDEVPPDWTLRLPDAFLVAWPNLRPSVFKPGGVGETHLLIDYRHDDLTCCDIWRGWYDPERRAEGIAAIAPLMEAFTAWRDGHRLWF